MVYIRCIKLNELQSVPGERDDQVKNGILIHWNIIFYCLLPQLYPFFILLSNSSHLSFRGSALICFEGNKAGLLINNSPT